MALTKVGKEGITGIDNSSDATAITIDSSEHVGIGIADPDGTLHVHSASAGSVTPQTDSDDLVVENNGHGGISVLTPDANRSAIVFGHASDNLKMQIRHDGGTSLSQIISDDTLTFNVSGGTERMRIDTNGHITMPTQTAFHARPASNRLNMGTGASIDMLFGTEVYDQNGDFDGQNGYVFTAPVTGKYLFTCMLVMFAVDKDYDYIETRIATSNRNYQNFIDPGTFAGDANYWTQTVTAVTDMDANDTCKIIFASTGGAEQLDISSMSTFSGALIC